VSDTVCVSVCDVGVLWLNVFIDQVGFWCEVYCRDNYFVLDRGLDLPTVREASIRRGVLN